MSLLEYQRILSSLEPHAPAKQTRSGDSDALRLESATSRDPLYQEAQAVALEAGASPSPARQLWWRWLAAECLRPPAIRVVWARAGSAAAQHHTGGSYFTGPSAILIGPLVDDGAFATASHEIGHHRGDLRLPSQLARECLAWTWAMEHSPAWTAAMHRHMRTCIATYLPTADLASNKDSLRLALVDELCSAASFERYERTIEQALEEADRAAVAERFGAAARCRGRLCAGRAAASRVVDDVPLCRMCEDNHQLNQQIAQLRSLKENRS